MTSGNSSIVSRLSIMMFLQFFAWGAWFATLAAALFQNNLSGFTGGAYESAPIAAVFAPLFLGLVADRFFASERVMGTLMLLGGVLLCLVPHYASEASAAGKAVVEAHALRDVAQQALGTSLSEEEQKEQDKADAKELQEVSGAAGGNMMLWLILGHLLCYMPTLGLGNTIAFTHITDPQHFPKVRVWGTIGWIAAGLFVGFAGWSGQFHIFWAGAVCSIALGLYSFTLPHTPPPLRGKPIDARSLLMLDAFALLKDFNFLVFAVCSTLICVPLAYYYGVTSTYLDQTGYASSAATMTLGQMSEIFFMLLIPFFFRRLGLKMMIMIGMGCWVLRYALFALAAPEQTVWMLLLAIALHGICYDFFFVTGFMYTDQKAPKEVRGQAQSLLVFLTQGVGMFFGYRIAFGGEFLGIPLDWKINVGGSEIGKQVDSTAYVEALKTARGEQTLTFVDSMKQMFSRDLPNTVDEVLLGNTMAQWKAFWFFPAIMAGIILVVFTLAFWDKAKAPQETDESSELAA